MPDFADPRTALVVDDDPEFRETLSAFLSVEGFNVAGAGNGLEALLYVKRQRPTVVLLDLMMPRLGGLDALKRIREFDPRIDVVILTAQDDDELRQQARSLGAIAFLTKPLDFEQLRAAIGPGQARVELAARRKPPVSQQADNVVGRAGRILVVDDDRDTASALQELLAGAGHDVRVASDGGTAIRAVVTDAPDLVLLDIEMPGLSGVDALAAIRAVAPAVRVIMLSGTTDPELAKRTLAFGAFEYIPKPFSVPHLLDIVQTVLAYKALDSGDDA